MAELEPGSVSHTVLLYCVSEPGEWTAEDIVDDLPDLELREVRRAIDELAAAGLLHVNSTDSHLWPTRAGKDLFRKAV
ncbi:MAG: hypothetical protein D6798_04490 [Deltaproteobacteria bacterium]|nr:MAG: hypothetical protein D6798_04490 [Deltaproteobacteria bacterium]